MTITLGSELETALQELARRRGVPAESLAIEALRERFLVPTRAVDTGDEWVQRLRGIATNCGVSLSDAAVSSEGIYE